MAQKCDERAAYCKRGALTFRCGPRGIRRHRAGHIDAWVFAQSRSGSPIYASKVTHDEIVNEAL